MTKPSYEANILLAIQAIKRDPKLSIRAAAKLYNIPRTTLMDRRAGRTARRDTRSKSIILEKDEEEAIVLYVIELSTRVFPPRIRGIEEMANILLCVRGAPPVGVNWASNFIKRQPELYTHWVRKYDYQRAKCEDPKVIRPWFTLVRNLKAKYSILDEDLYNFDETGFMIGVIFPGMVVTTSEGCTKAKLVQPGNRE
jgi:hypothetical protein